MKKNNYVAYLFTSYYYDEFENKITEPLRIIETKEKAYNYFFDNEGGLAIYGIRPDGEIDPILVSEPYCLDYSDNDDKEWRREHIKDIKYYLKDK